LELAT